jgi:hypothetical protein
MKEFRHGNISQSSPGKNKPHAYFRTCRRRSEAPPRLPPRSDSAVNAGKDGVRNGSGTGAIRGVQEWEMWSPESATSE